MTAIARLLLALLVLLVASPAWAAWSFIGATDLGNVHSGSRSVTAGNLLITVYTTGNSPDNPSISDGVNTWTKIGTTMSDGTNNNSLSWWWAVAATTATITVTATGGVGDAGMAIIEWHSSAGNVPSTSLETNHQNFQSPGVSGTDNTTSGTVTAPSNNGDLFISFAGDTQGVNNLTSGTGFTDRLLGSGAIPIRIEDFIQSTAAAKAGTWTNSVTDVTGTFAAFFKEAAAGGAKKFIIERLGVRPFAPGPM